MRRFVLTLGMIILLPPFLFAESGDPSAVKETLVPLGHSISGEEIYVDSLKISPDLKHIGYVSRIGTTFRVWLDGVSEKSHKGVTRQSPFFSPQGNRLVYVAQEDDKMYVVVDGEEHDGYKQAGTITFSSDGSRLAYRVEDEKGRQMVVVDGEVGPRFDIGITNAIGIVFSPDSKHFAYVGINQNNSCIFVKDNKKLRSVDKIDRIKFSPDSKHVAYTAMEKGEWFVVLDGKNGRKYKKISGLTFSPDSREIIYMAQKSRRPIIVRNEEEISDGLGVFFPTFSPKGKRFAYLKAEKNNVYHYVIDGKEELGVGQPGRLVFSHDETSTAYAAFIGGDWYIIKDGVKGPPFKKIFALSFSPTTNDIVYAADNKDGKTCVVRNQTPGDYYESIGVPVFNPDGLSYAYVARENDKEMFMVLNDKKLPAYPIIGIPGKDENGNPGFSSQRAYFSKYGNRMAYPVFDPDKKRAFMVVDGIAQPAFDLVMEPCFSDDEKHIGYMAKTGKEWHLVVDGRPGSLTCDGLIRDATIAYDLPRDCFFILVANETDTGLSFYRLEAAVKPSS